MNGFGCLRYMLTGVMAATIIVSCDSAPDKRETADNSATTVPLPEEGFHGWDSYTIRNMFVKLDVVPDLGGKIMGYDLNGYQLLWHDATSEGVVDNDQGYGFGEKFFNPGGAKVWPAPQGWSGPNEWPGPPDNVLDSAVYDVDFTEDAVTVTSPDDDAAGRTGLRFGHTYSIRNQSTIVDLHLTMTNVVDRPVEWALWHLVTLPVDRDMYVKAPVVSDSDWRVMFGTPDNPQWLGVDNGLFTAEYGKKVGKVGMKTSDGWTVWYDRQKKKAFAVMFPVKKGARYPDAGSNVEIWTAGEGSVNVNNQDFTYQYDPATAMLELEVLGPMEKLNPGDTKALDLQWGICTCSDVVDVTEGGIISKPMKYENGRVTGSFGVFYAGRLQVINIDSSGNTVSTINFGEVGPLMEVVIDQDASMFSQKTAIARYQIRDYGGDVLAVVCDVPIK